MTYGHPNIQRPGPRIDERRDDPQERQTIRAGIAVGFRHATARRLPEMTHLGVYLTGEKRDGMREWGIK